MEFDPLYQKHAEPLLVWFTRRLLDPDTALDIWSETFAQAYARRRAFRGKDDDQAAAWLYGIAKRRLADYLRRGYAERRAMERLGMPQRHLDSDEYDRLLDLAGIQELRAQVGAALEALPADQREALRLRVVEELPYPEVARRLDVTEPTARARVSRGLRRMSIHLEEAR